MKKGLKTQGSILREWGMKGWGLMVGPVLKHPWNLPIYFYQT